MARTGNGSGGISLLKKDIYKSQYLNLHQEYYFNPSDGRIVGGATIKTTIFNCLGPDVDPSRINIDFYTNIPEEERNTCYRMHVNAHGLLDRKDGPAFIIDQDNKGFIWCRDGLIYRDDGPAVIRFDKYYMTSYRAEDLMYGRYYFYFFNEHILHRDNGPAYISFQVKNPIDVLSKDFNLEKEIDKALSVDPRPPLVSWFIKGKHCSLEKYVYHYPDVSFEMDRWKE